MVWPDVSARLVRSLRRRGVDRDAAEDAAQEAAARALASGVPFEDADDLFRWAVVVAHRVAIDGYRRDRRIVGGVMPDTAGPVDVETVVENRRRINAVATAMARLPAADVAALRSVGRCAPATSRREGVRQAVRLHRARARLSAMVERLAALVGWRLGRSQQQSETAVVAAAAASSMILAVGSFLVAGGHQPQASPPAADVDIHVTRLPARNPAGHGVSARVAGPPEKPATSPAGDRRTDSRVELSVPRPDGGGKLGGYAEPKAPGDQFLCADTVALGHRCIDLDL